MKQFLIEQHTSIQLSQMVSGQNGQLLVLAA